jgi:hypothetical protein
MNGSRAKLALLLLVLSVSLVAGVRSPARTPLAATGACADGGEGKSLFDAFYLRMP